MVGHNSASLDSNDRGARFFSHLNPIWELEQQRVELVAEITKLKRQAKADGFEAYEINQGLQVRKSEKPETIDNQMARLMAVMKFMNQPIGHQFDFLNDPNLMPDTDRAFNAGMAAGLRADPFINPYGQGLPQYGAFEDGYAQGQAQVRAATQARMEAENARIEANGSPPEKRGPGRPKGSRNKPKLVESVATVEAAEQEQQAAETAH